MSCDNTFSKAAVLRLGGAFPYIYGKDQSRAGLLMVLSFRSRLSWVLPPRRVEINLKSQQFGHRAGVHAWWIMHLHTHSYCDGRWSRWCRDPTSDCDAIWLMRGPPSPGCFNLWIFSCSARPLVRQNSMLHCFSCLMGDIDERSHAG